jgi:hypothetical protein
MDVSRLITLRSLDQLLKHYGTETRQIERKLVELDRSSRPILGRRLRTHLVQPVREREWQFRNDVDNLLEYYSLLELCYLTGNLTLRGDEVERIAKRVLNIESVRRFYEEFYPLILPTALRLRLDGSPALEQRESDIVSSLVVQGYDWADDDLDVFVGLLDDG